MIKKILPILLLLIGAGGGMGAGLFLRPAPEPAPEPMAVDTAEAPADADGETKVEAAEKPAEEVKPEDEIEPEYAKMNNQFVVPIVVDDAVKALVVLSLSVEVQAGQKDTIYEREPKLRDSFLQVLFNHANRGGFDGAFTDAKRMNTLRMALREVAQRDFGEIVQDVLILEIARQDY